MTTTDIQDVTNWIEESGKSNNENVQNYLIPCINWVYPQTIAALDVKIFNRNSINSKTLKHKIFKKNLRGV